MSLASHLKVKMESERSAALALDKAAEAFRTGSTQVLNDVRGGFERATWYGSCLFDRYNDVCSELNNENKRFFLSISEVYKRNDVILDMVRIYLNYELDKVDGKNNLIQDLDRKIAGVLSSYQVGNVTKTAIANSVSVLVCRSLKFNDFVLKNINRAALIFVTFFSLYGKIQVSALSARRLKLSHPELYHQFYEAGVEMLYFLIEDRIDESMKLSGSEMGEDRFLAIVKTLTQ